MRFALAGFAFLVAAICFLVVIASSFMAIRKHYTGELERVFEAEDAGLVTLLCGISFYAIIGAIALVLGLVLLGKSRH
jgi:hypothetical protein